MFRLIKDEDSHWYVIGVSEVDAFRKWEAAPYLEVCKGKDFNECRVNGPHEIEFKEWSWAGALGPQESDDRELPTMKSGSSASYRAAGAMGPQEPDDAPKESIAEVICRLIEADPHQWSKRPCPTCRAVSALLGRNFGCDNHRNCPGPK